LLEEVFDLNMQLEELRMQKKLGEDDPSLIEEIGRQKLELEEKHEALLDQLKGEWTEWDRAVDGGAESDRLKIRDKMVEVLNRRSYLRNLVRDVNEVLES
jgi:molecular chaperone HscB